MLILCPNPPPVETRFFDRIGPHVNPLRCSLRHAHLHSFVLDPEDAGSVWGLSGTSVKEEGSHDLDMRLQGTTSLSKRPTTCTGPKGLEPITILFYSYKTARFGRQHSPSHQTTIFLSCVSTIVTRCETCMYDHSHETNRLNCKIVSHVELH